jgi:hypothetical protein
MVTEFGFSEKLGPLRYADNEEEVFLGHSVTQRKNVSDATAKIIDEEIRRIVDEGERTAREILTGHLDELHALAKGLLEYETLSADEIRRLIKGERIVRDVSTPAPLRSPARAGAARCPPPAVRAASNRSPSPAIRVIQPLHDFYLSPPVLSGSRFEAAKLSCDCPAANKRTDFVAIWRPFSARMPAASRRLFGWR